MGMAKAIVTLTWPERAFQTRVFDVISRQSRRAYEVCGKNAGFVDVNLG